MGAARKVGAGAVAAVAAAVGLAGSEAPAGANHEWRPFTGDVTLDGLSDRLSFGAVDDGPVAYLCHLAVEPGLAGGGYGPAVDHAVAVPTSSIGFDCPSVGGVVDLGGDGTGEVLLAWGFGNLCNIGSCPSGPLPDLLVLRDWQVTDQLYDLPVDDVNGIATRDLNLDGLVDAYWGAADSSGFMSLLNSPSGELSVGPLAHACSSDGSTGLVDFNENDKPDLLVWSPYSCPTFGAAGVGVVLDDGTAISVAPGWDWGDGAVRAEYAADVNADGHVDIVAKNGSGQVTAVWLGNGQGGFAAK